MNILLAGTFGLLLAGCHGMVVEDNDQLNTLMGLPPSVLYQYKYTSTLSTWVSEDATQFSGSALRADVELQRTQDAEIRVKVNNVEVAEINEKTSCEPQKNIDFMYEPVDEATAALMKQPFLIQSVDTVDYFMRVPNEPLWMTNVRRGIINSLPLFVLMGHGTSRLTFRLTEDTIIGKCFNWYSQLRLGNYEADIVNRYQDQKVEVDVQRYATAGRHTSDGSTFKGRPLTKTPSRVSKSGRKTSSKTRSGTKKGTKTGGPTEAPSRLTKPINDTLWRLTRTLDDMGCKENHFTVEINGNHESVERIQRSSESTFLVRGDLGSGIRLERAEVNGNILVYTGECQDKFVRTKSKQELELRAVRVAGEQVDLAQELEKKTLIFEDKVGPQLITVEQQLTGIQLTQQQILDTITVIKEELFQLGSEDSDQPKEIYAIMDVFLHLVELVSVLGKEDIHQLFSQLSSLQERKVLEEALIASGSKQAMSYLVEKMKDKNYRIDNGFIMMKFFNAIPVSVRDPSIVLDLLDIVSCTSDDPDRRVEEPFKALFTFSIAKLVRQYCLDAQTAAACDQCSNSGEIVTRFLSTLSYGLKDPEKWKRLVFLQAMCTLGTPLSIPILEPIIQGNNNEDIDLRISAIYCLMAHHLPKTAHSAVMDLLVPLLNNPTEFPEVRSIAFLVISSWEPSNLSWWEYIALSTWKENSTLVGDFISNALTSLAEGNDPRSLSAKKVIHLAKPRPRNEEFSVSNSVYLYLAEELKNCKAGRKIKLAWLTSTQSIFPRTMFYYLHATTVMGMLQTNSIVLLGNLFQDIYKNVYPTLFDVKESEDSETFFAIFEELQEQLELISTSFIDRKPYTFASIFQPLHVIYLRYLDELQGPSNMLTFGLTSLRTLYNLPITFRLADTTLAFPTDSGLPVIVKHAEDYILYLEDRSNIDGFHFIIKAAGKTSVWMKTLVPWGEGRAVGAGLESYAQVYLPLNLSFNEMLSQLKLMLPPAKIDLVAVSSNMYTSLMSLFPFLGASNNLGRKVVWRGELLEGTTKVPVADMLGVHLGFEWKTDTNEPADFYTVLKNYQLLYRNFEYRMVFDPSVSSSKIIKLMGLLYMKDNEKVTQESDDQFSQVSQGAADYEFMSQVSGSSDTEIFGQTSSGAFNFDQDTQSQTFITHMQRTEQLTTTRPDFLSHMVTLVIEPDAFPRKYELVITESSVKRHKLGESSPYKLHISFVNSSMTDIFGDAHWTCIDINAEIAYVTPLFPKDLILMVNVSQSLSVSMYNEPYCVGSPVLQFEARENMSRTSLQHIQAIAYREACDGSFPTRLLPVYDTAHVEITGNKEFIRNTAAVQKWISCNLNLDVIDAVIDTLQSHATVTADVVRNLETNQLKMSITGPHKTSEFTLPLNGLLQTLPLNFVQDYMFDAFSDHLDKACYLSQNSIRTFDGLLHPFEPSSCWTVATIHIGLDHSKWNRYLQMAVQTRYIDDHWEVRLSWPFAGLQIDMTRSDILVNEEPFIGESDKYVLHRMQDSQLLEAGLVLVWVGETVQIRVSDLYYGEVAGLCGNYDGEPSNDMKGPLGCLYTDSALHTTAWSSPAVGCSRLALRTERAQLEDFQQTCQKEVFQPTGITQRNVMANCTMWEYHDRSTPDGLQCTSKVPVPVCLPGCEAGLTFTSKLKYDCLLSPSTSEQEQQQQNQQYGGRNCFIKVMPATIHAGCFQEVPGEPPLW